jgi:redox-sensing transcriptional repressor
MILGRCNGSVGMISDKTIGRLSLYRRVIGEMLAEGRSHVFSHEIAKAAGVTAAQVRRDLMPTGHLGTPSRGYNISGLIQSISNLLDDPEQEKVAIIGVGNLGRAILAYFLGRRPNLTIVAAFDSDPGKVGRVIHGIRCYSMDQLVDVVRKEGIEVGILTVPARAAQAIADEVIAAGVRGLLNFAPVALRVPPQVHVEDLDVAISLERVAYFARHGVGMRRPERTRR